jgi:hypothetical protein
MRDVPLPRVGSQHVRAPPLSGLRRAPLRAPGPDRDSTFAEAVQPAPAMSGPPGIDVARRTTAALSDRLIRMSVYPTDGSADRWKLKSVNEAAYFFLGSAAPCGGLSALWGAAAPISPRTVYFRHRDGRVFRTGFTTLESLRLRLDPTKFVPVGRGLLINVDKLEELDFAGKLKQVAIRVGTELELLPVSRRAARVLRRMFGFPRRLRDAGDPA